MKTTSLNKKADMNTELIWNSFKEKLFHFIKSRVKDEVIAEDILQEVFLKIHLHLDQLKDEKKLTSWLFQICRNTITDYFRTKKINSPLTESLTEDVDKKSYLEFEKCILGFVNHLPEKYRESLLQTELGKLSQKEYAEKIGISYSGAKSRVQRAKEELKSLFISCYGPKTIDGKTEIKDPEDCNCK